MEQRERKLFQRDLALWEYRLAWKSQHWDLVRPAGAVEREESYRKSLVVAVVAEHPFPQVREHRMK